MIIFLPFIEDNHPFGHFKYNYNEEVNFLILFYGQPCNFEINNQIFFSHKLFNLGIVTYESWLCNPYTKQISLSLRYLSKKLDIQFGQESKKKNCGVKF